jgi:hypothetical protein
MPARLSRVGDRPFKTELIKPRGPWRTAEQVELATLEYVDWFNHRRLYGACGDVPLAGFEAELPSHCRPHRGRPGNNLSSLRTHRGGSHRPSACPGCVRTVGSLRPGDLLVG